MKKLFAVVLCAALLLCVSALADETKLYYNPDGGTYYHVDAMCSSIAYKYRPLTASFTESELNDEPYASLQPCEVCGAPARPTVTPTPAVEYDVVQSISSGSEAIAQANGILLTTGDFTQEEIDAVCDAELTLYYNPKGGVRYHSDVNCSAVDKKYLPLSGSLEYEDLLTKKYADLVACEVCGAPAKPDAASMLQTCVYDPQTEDDNGHWIVTYTRNGQTVAEVTLDESNGQLVSLNVTPE